MLQSDIRRLSLEEQQDLIGLLDQLIGFAASFTGRVENGQIVSAIHQDTFEQINAQIDLIESVRSLCLDGRYRSSFIVIRAILEHYLAIRLAGEARRYALQWKRRSGQSVQSAIQSAENWVKEAIEADRRDVLRVKKDGKGIYVVFDGPYANGVRSKANRYSFYMQVFQNYDPDQYYLPNEMLPSPWVDGDRERVTRDREYQRSLHYQFMTVGRLIFHSRINRFLTKKQNERWDVHYNFLSHFVHPSQSSVETLREDGICNCYIDSVWDLRHYDFHICHLILLYLAFLTLMYCEMQDRIVTRASKKYFKGISHKSNLEQYRNELISNFGYFWFIYHGFPHEIVKFNQIVSEPKNSLLPEGFRAGDLDDAKVKYYPDPLQHLHELSHTWQNRVLGRVAGPLVTHPPPL